MNRALIVALVAFSASASFAQHQAGESTPLGPADGAPPRTHQWRYFESSIGLTPPRWDGGRTELELADLNLDGHLDIVTIGDHGSPYINTDMHGISVWFGDGTGRWQSYQTGSFGYGGIDVADVNNDGLPDVGYGMHHNYSGNDLGDQLLEVALGDGTGRQWSPWDDGLGENGEDYGMFGTEFADIDADGFMDLGSTSFGCCNGFHVYRNNADGTWDWSFASPGGNSAMDITSGDVNNDGFPDFATAVSNGTIWINNGTGQFTPTDTGLPAGGTFGRRGPDLGDVNHDGFDDVSFVNGNGGLEVWVWDGESAWNDFSGSLPNTGNSEVTKLRDMNRDGHLDLIAFGNARIAIFLGDGDGAWTLAHTFTSVTPGHYAGLAIADLDHNGYPDIALVSDDGGWFSSTNKLQVYLEASDPDRAWIRMTAPVAHRILLAGASTFFEWQSASPGRVSSTVTLELSTSGPRGPWIPVVENTPDNGRYQLVLPADLNSADCYLKATIRAGSRVSTDLQGPFSILQ